MFRFLFRTVAVIAAIFLAIQFVHPSLPNPPVTGDLEAPPEVKRILKSSCYNCHSNETRLVWFDYPAPAYWIVRGHVLEARKHINFSEIAKLPAAQQKAALYEGLFQISRGAMPIPAYVAFHPDARISEQDVTVLKNYLLAISPAQKGTSDDAGAAQYEKWIATGNEASSPQPAPNGIPFPSDYKNWKPISSTERFDNNTIRQILGNDIAIKAIAENQINPWPDGATFAKIAWFEQTGPDGIIRPGEFFQVEFMIRDKTKYANTLGWGWARWRGADLKPYGKDANFVDECVGCHRPMEDTNYVFTEPIRGQQ
jgi:heme-binding protein/cytochrome P460